MSNITQANKVDTSVNFPDLFVKLYCTIIKYDFDSVSAKRGEIKSQGAENGNGGFNGRCTCDTPTGNFTQLNCYALKKHGTRSLI